MTDTDRKRLAAILGMLGSNSAGERAAAALQAEAFRRKHGMTWEQLVSGQTVYVDRERIVESAIFIDRPVPLPLLKSFATVLAEPMPCFFTFTVGLLTIVAFVRLFF